MVISIRASEKDTDDAIIQIQNKLRDLEDRLSSLEADIKLIKAFLSRI